jgi:class 3 adenylate cyclase
LGSTQSGFSSLEITKFEEKLSNVSKLPYIQDLETAVLFADISGFTKASETF